MSKKNENKTEKKGKQKYIRILGLCTFLLIAGAMVVYAMGGSSNEQVMAEASYTEQEIVRSDITESLTGSAAIESANSYTIISTVEAEILSSNFEEGDIVDKDSVLYQLDSSDAMNTIETNEISLAASQRSYNDAIENLNNLNVKAPIAGTVIDIAVEVGDDVNANQTVATIRDSSTMEAKFEFSADDADNFYEGQTATVTLDGSFEMLDGTITNVSAVSQVGTGNKLTKTVTISVNNPGGLSNTQLATAAVAGIGSLTNSTFDYAGERTVVAEVAGEVESIMINEGDIVSEDEITMKLTSDNVSDSIQSQSDNLRKSEISYENAQESLDKYTITSPITGTVVEKNYLVGETADQGTTLCTIYDLSYLTFTLNIDELDIADIEVGQEVSITASALEGEQFTGVVTKVSVVGSSSGGVTTYPVTVQVEEFGNLLPGMNIDAEILIQNVENTLAMPIAALNRTGAVLITATSPSAVNAIADMEAPEGYVYVMVETGASNDNYIEITSGLQEGDVVAYMGMTISSSDDMGIMIPGMTTGGGMPTGGTMPSGGGMSGGGGGGGNRP